MKNTILIKSVNENRKQSASVKRSGSHYLGHPEGPKICDTIFRKGLLSLESSRGDWKRNFSVFSKGGLRHS